MAGLSANQRKRLQIHPAGLIIILLALASWVVALGGVGVSSNNCVADASKTTSATYKASLACVAQNATDANGTVIFADDNKVTPLPLKDANGVTVFLSTPCGVNVQIQCGLNYQMQWWTLFFEGILLIALFVSVFFETFEKGKQAFTSFFIMCTTLLMYSSNQFIKDSAANFQGSVTFSGGQAANNAGAAGYVLLCIWNFCLLIILGYTPTRPAGPTPQQLRDEIPMNSV